MWKSLIPNEAGPLFHLFAHFYPRNIIPGIKKKKVADFSWPRRVSSHRIRTIIAFHWTEPPRRVQSNTRTLDRYMLCAAAVPFTTAASQKGSNALRDWLMKIITWHSRSVIFFAVIIISKERRLPSLFLLCICSTFPFLHISNGKKNKQTCSC